MSEEKITISQLRRRVAERSGVNEQKVGSFIDTLLMVMTDALMTDGTVRLTDLGTFRRQQVDKRESVDVSTGQRIEIAGYWKVGFTPDAGLKEKINQPFAHLSSVLLDADGNPMPTDPNFNAMQRLDEQANEIKDLLAEIQDHSEEQTPNDQTTDTNIEQANLPIEQHSANIQIEQHGANSVEQTSSSTIKQPVPSSTEQVNKPVVEQQKEKSTDFHPFRAAIITVLFFCLLLVGGYFFLQYKITSWADKLIEQRKTAKTEYVDKSNNGKNATTDLQPTINNDVPLTKPKEEQQTPQTKEVKKDINKQVEELETITFATVNEGSRLSWLSRKYYGSPDYWVYIYIANTDIIKDPNNLPIGQKLRIPRLPDQWTDKTNDAYIKQAQDLHNKILNQ